ncbi:hypothetical protein [Leptolyngbya iicbica]|uniref:Uncharacterized protein n=2 Tax=Cyanophyceae TaxID=3028117 RepID=A0A4Q7E3J0_9CYAN|nr:hypothetical protein [Leptolyngbya sp. LK]RZM76108.1 hypothetical protein DYY88_19680 [Leptolyngbya sp. LK]
MRHHPRNRDRPPRYPQWQLLCFGILVGLALAGRLVGLAVSWAHWQSAQKTSHPGTSSTYLKQE